MKKKSLLSVHAKSFNWAGFFLPKETYKKCSILYDFCRTLDDIADSNLELVEKKKIFLSFKKNFEYKNFSNLIIKNFCELVEIKKIPLKVIYDLFDGVESDIRSKVYIQSEKDLIVYSYRVAGTVGLMMSKIFDIKDKDALRGAIDLGIAMQLTNIARDVIEDKGKNRFYISHDFEKIRETLKTAETFYSNSFLAIKHIPIRFRFSILVARRVYREIGKNIIKKKNLSNYDKAGKIYVSLFGKITQTIFSVFDLIKLQFLSNNDHVKKEEKHLIIDKEINLNERF